MEDEVKKNMKTLKDMKVDKRANAYLGILEEIKKWLIFLPLISELRDPAMRERHWNAIRNKVKVNFIVDEAKMEKTLAKLEETWKDIKLEF